MMNDEPLGTNKEKPGLNKEQTAAAYCENNAVVSAGAGSGKTMVLASRYVWMITEKQYRPREILTLTFTKKATAQMYRRIYRELSDTAKNGGAKRAIAEKALDEFSQARIQTIDSYSSSIVRQAANRYGIRPDFLIDIKRCRRLAVDESLPFVIAHRNHPALERLYSQKNSKIIAEKIFADCLYENTFIDSPPDPRSDIIAQSAIICSEWEKYSNIIREKIDTLTCLNGESELHRPDLVPLLDQYNSGLVEFPQKQDLRRYFDQLADMPHNAVMEWAEIQPLQNKLAYILNYVLSLRNLNLSKGKRYDNPLKETLKEIKNLFHEFSSLIIYCRQAGLLYSVLTLLAELQQRYLDRKRAEGILKYSDVARLAKKILLEQLDIRQSEKESFKAIMIDEFQDNNELQKELLFLLAEDQNISNQTMPQAKDLSPGKLFFVGDEKQSIFGFRDADVSVFRKLQSELGSTNLPLSTNYRSAPELINAFNTIFKDVFAPGPDLPPYEAEYTPLSAHAADKPSRGKLTLCILDKSAVTGENEENQNSETKDSADEELLQSEENEARYVTEKIKDLLADGKYKPGDIAILFRTGSTQHLFEKHLMLLDIPYVNENLGGFFFGGPVNDIMSILRLAAYPMDRTAYAQVLRSPFSGLSLPGLSVCLATHDDGCAFSPFNEDILVHLDERDREIFIQGQFVYNNILDKSSTKNISSLLSDLWYDEGYRYETEWNTQTTVYRELFDYLFHLAVQADNENQSLAEFTDFILNLNKSIIKLEDIDLPLDRFNTEAGGAVQLLTVHKSKGLEFPVVFLVCCHKTDYTDRSDAIEDTGTAGLTLNPPLPLEYADIKEIKPNYFWERDNSLRRGKKTAELRRLLYVGMTRAEKELYISGCLDISKMLEKEKNAVITDNFTVNLKQFAEIKAVNTAKTEKEKNITKLQGDKIINNNTFFGLCLPVFCAHIPDDGLDPKSSFFAIEEIPPYSEQYIQDTEQQGSRFSNNQKGLDTFFKNAKPFYQNVNIIETPIVTKKHFTPTSLPAEIVDNIPAGSFITNKEYSSETGANIFVKVDALLDRYAAKSDDDNDRFTYAGFGTIAHICVEALLDGQEAAIPPKLAGLLSPTDADDFLTAGKELAKRFIESPLGIIAASTKKRKSEFPFRSLVSVNGKDFFINGTIDLLFEDDESVHVVDFKTDSEEAPELHAAQMACYRQAAMDLFAGPTGKKCRVWLYYMRTGNVVEIAGI